jgi:2-haloacid dehalogenase
MRTTVIFDLGGVLIDFDPRHLFRKLFPGDEAGMEHFLSEVCTSAWNLEQDAGRSWADATQLLKIDHPGFAPMIDAYYQRWPEMIAGPIAGTVRILETLKAQKTPLYGLTNWSRETFPVALQRFDFMSWFDGIVVSGQEKLIKPDPRIYRLLVERYGLKPEQLVYIDDNSGNAAAATALGMHAIHFLSPAQLAGELQSLDLLPRP